MLDSKINALKLHFGIYKVADWGSVEPAWILAKDGCGPKTLDYIRVLLATHGLTLKNDRTPEYWKKHLPEVQIVDSLTDDDEGEDKGAVAPFVVYVDSAEQEPYTFQGFRTDARDGNPARPLFVPTEVRSLGRWPNSLGDYAVDCGLGRCHIERKSMADLQSTVLGFRVRSTDEDGVSRRDRFERELHNLSELAAGLVIVEATLEDVIAQAPQTDHRSPQANAKILFRSLLAYQQDYAVQWQFCSNREWAERYAFRWLERFARKQIEASKLKDRNARKLREERAKEIGQEKETAGTAT